MPFSDILTDELIKHNIDLLRFDAATRRRIRALLSEMQDQLVAKLSTVDFSSSARRARLESLLEQVDLIVRSSYRGMNSSLHKDLKEVAKAEEMFTARKMNSLFSVDIVSPALTPEKLRAIAKDANILGAPAKEWWGRQAARTRNAFANEMRQGFLLGESTQDLVRRVRGTSTGNRITVELPNGSTRRVHQFAGGILDVSTREAEALVRTSVQSVANQTRLETYEANTDVIKALQALVVLDNRTTDICISHGSIPDTWDAETKEPIGGSNAWTGPPPWHYNCRSTLIPITRSWEELQNRANGRKATRKQKRIARLLDNNAPKRTRASMNGQVPAGVSFEKWLKRQPKSTQLDLLGPTKRKLWLDGQLNFTQLIDQSGRPLTIEQLKQRIGA